MRLGVLDVGSNTVHHLVVDAHYGAAPMPAAAMKTPLRLAEYLQPDGTIAAVAVDRLAEFVTASVVLGEELGVTESLGFATSAIRSAPNGDEVVAEVLRRTGVALEVLSGDEEATLTYLAARRWFGWSAGRLLVLDIGGGSLELAIGADEEPDVVASVPLGAGRLTRGLVGDPPSPEDVRALRVAVRAGVADVAGRILRAGPHRLAVATSKTFKQLARIAGAAPSADGLFVRRRLARDDVRAWLPRLAEMPERERAALPGVSEGRAGQLLAGALVAEAAMDLLEVDCVDICPWALREGVILRRLDRLVP